MYKEIYIVVNSFIPQRYWYLFIVFKKTSVFVDIFYIVNTHKKHSYFNTKHTKYVHKIKYTFSLTLLEI